ncbi:hypothetical protein [Photobacterium satsumensis]|uniref:hypothetical protein n=1 Tax=Photobacterium satsumensis TaxID=2910239 RepID=UPI003D0AE98F
MSHSRLERRHDTADFSTRINPNSLPDHNLFHLSVKKTPTAMAESIATALYSHYRTVISAAPDAYIPKLPQGAGFRELSAHSIQGEGLQEWHSLSKSFNEGVNGLTPSRRASFLSFYTALLFIDLEPLDLQNNALSISL